MRVLIVGAHGRIARLASRRLIERGHEVVGIVRREEHVDDLRGAGVEPVVLDLEHAAPAELADALDGADALVFAAGAGPGSGRDRKETVDHLASDLCVAAAGRAGVRRFVQISSMGTDDPPGGDTVIAHYLRAKAAAELTLRDSSLDWTILRPGRLIDAPARGTVTLARSVPRAQVPRADVAAVIVELLDSGAASGRTLELVSGDIPVADAVAGH